MADADPVWTGDGPAPWRRLASRVVHRTPWCEMRDDDVVRPDGARTRYAHVVVPGSVTVLAVDGGDRAAVTRQWVYTHGRPMWRLPGGGIDPGDTSPLAAAMRELREETGITASRWRRLGVVHGADSVTNHIDNVFLASRVRVGPAAPEPGEADLAWWWLPLDRLTQMVAAGQMAHAGSCFAVLALAVARAGFWPRRCGGEPAAGGERSG